MGATTQPQLERSTDMGQPQPVSRTSVQGVAADPQGQSHAHIE